MARKTARKLAKYRIFVVHPLNLLGKLRFAGMFCTSNLSILSDPSCSRLPNMPVLHSVKKRSSTFRTNSYHKRCNMNRTRERVSIYTRYICMESAYTYLTKATISKNKLSTSSALTITKTRFIRNKYPTEKNDREESSTFQGWISLTFPSPALICKDDLHAYRRSRIPCTESCSVNIPITAYKDGV